MKYADKRCEAIALFRQHCREKIAAGASTASTLDDLRSAMNALLQEFCVEHEVRGVRYWHVSEDNSYFVTLPGERLEEVHGSTVASLAIGLQRYEFLSRQGVHFDYDDRL